MIERFYVHDATIIRAAVRDGRYGEELDWSDATERTVKGWVTPRVASDLALANRDEASHRDLSVAYFESYFPPGTDLKGSDRVSCHGTLSEVVGLPRQAFHPEDGVNHIEALLKAVEG